MSHTSVMLIHESDEDSIMAKYYFEADENDGGQTEFVCQITVKNAKKEYKISADKNKYPTFESYMDNWYGYELNEDKTEYGSSSNTLGKYDWYFVGGRWKNSLPETPNKKLKKLYNDTLNMKNEKGIKLFRDNIELFVQVSQMSFQEACAYMKIGGCDSIVISKEISAESILERFKAILKFEGNINNNDILPQFIWDSIIIENENGEETVEEPSTKLFINTYNRLLKINEKEGREFKVTILDLHS